MNVLKTFTGFLAIKPEEKKTFRQLFLLSLFTGTAMAFYFVAVNTFLIQKASVYNLPYAYIISGTVGFFLIKVYQYRQKQTHIIRSYRESILCFSIVAILVYIAFLKYGNSGAFGVYVAYLGFLFNMPFTIIFSLGFFSICARVFNLAQSKRLLALVGMGEIVATIFAYLIAPEIIRLTGGVVNLLLIAGLCIPLSFIPLTLISKGHVGKLHLTAVKPVNTAAPINITFFFKDNFFMLIAVASIFSVAAIYFVDYAYLISVRFMTAETGIQIAVIVSVFFTIVKTGELGFSLLSGSLLSSKGIRFCLVLLPLILTGCFLLSFIAGFALKNALFVFAFIFLAKLAERVIRKAITTPATKVLYQVTGPTERMQIEANIEGLLNQVSTVMTGAVLLLFSRLFKGNDPMLFLSAVSVVCFIAFTIWLVLNLKLYERYKQKIQQYLDQLKGTVTQNSDPYVGDLIGGCSITINNSYPQLHNTIIKATTMIHEQHRALQIVSFYNPSVLYAAADDAILHQKLISAYYVNDNFFSRLSIIRYIAASKITLAVFNELWKISDTDLRLELINLYLTNEQYDADVYYFENLCKECANEIVWTMNTVYDMATTDNAILQTELNLLIGKLRKVLFGLLKVIYEPASINVIAEIMNNHGQNVEDQFFALELLDNILSPGLKFLLIPVFEPVPFEQKISHVKKLYPIYTLDTVARLREILMKDYKVTGAAIKELALVTYYQLSGDTQLIKAFKRSKLVNLSTRAATLLNSDLTNNSGKNQVINSLSDCYRLNSGELTYLTNWALPDKKMLQQLSAKKVKKINPYLVDLNSNEAYLIDGLAIALLVSQATGCIPDH